MGAYVFIGITASAGEPIVRTVLLDAHFRFTALRTMFADGVQRVVVVSTDGPAADLIERAKRLASDEATRPVRAEHAQGELEHFGLVASYWPADIPEAAPLVAVTSSLDEATAVALEFIDCGATGIEIVRGEHGGVAELARTVLELADQWRPGVRDTKKPAGDADGLAKDMRGTGLEPARPCER